MSEEQTVHTVDKLNARIRAIVEKETIDKPLWVGGVIRGMYPSDIGHIYFTLSDDPYSIRCILRKNRQGSIGFTPQAHMEVEIFGAVRVYEQRATIEIEVEDMRLVKGQLMTNFQPVQKQLAKKGLWPPEKRSLPQKINRIGVVTSKQSDALPDFETNYRREEGKAAIELADVHIEGEFAPQEIADAITRLNRENEVDVIVVTRGGGRRSEMTIFDDLLIAEAICRSPIPVVTAIGHERDSFFADQVADLSVSTPTAAAVQLARPHKPVQVPDFSASIPTTPTSRLPEPHKKDLNLVFIAVVALAVIVFIALLVLILST